MDAHPDPLATPVPSSPGLDDHQTDEQALHHLLCDLGQELCHPLASLRNGFDSLLDDAPKPIPPEHQSHVATITGLCDDLLRLAQGYLDYAEAARPSSPLRPENLTLGAVVDELGRRFGSKARDRGLTFETTVDAADAEIVTDAERCARIFANLIDNAIAYTPRGGRIRVEARVDGDSWLLTVEDDGPGIPAESQAKVFEPFHRLNRDEHSSTPGEGLGLSICRELAAQLRGRILLKSEVDRGTRFTVVLPKSPDAIN